MRLVLKASVLCGACILAACTVDGTGDEVLIPDPIDPCGARSVQFLVGQSEDRLNNRRYAAPLRILRDGDEVKRNDVDPNRLTARISAKGRVASLTCE